MPELSPDEIWLTLENLHEELKPVWELSDETHATEDVLFAHVREIHDWNISLTRDLTEKLEKISQGHEQQCAQFRAYLETEIVKALSKHDVAKLEKHVKRDHEFIEYMEMQIQNISDSIRRG